MTTSLDEFDLEVSEIIEDLLRARYDELYLECRLQCMKYEDNPEEYEWCMKLCYEK